MTSLSRAVPADLSASAAVPHLGERGLTLTLPDGRTAYFNYYWLRDNDPTSFDRTTRERTFDIFHLDSAPQARRAWLDADRLVIEWASEAYTTQMPLAWLQSYADGQARPDPADLPRRPWFGDHYPDVARFSHGEVLADPAKVKDWLAALIIEGIAIITDMPDSDAALTALVAVMGQVRPTFFGAYFDVKTHLNPTNSAYTAGALELHTDTPAEEVAPGIQFLHMRRNSVQGGLNLFADGVAAAEEFRRLDPQGFKLLSSLDIPFYCEHDDYDMRSYQRVIELDRHGQVSGVTISQHMLDLIDLPQHLLDDYYPAFCRFGKLLQQDHYLMKFTLKAGECIVFDNHRIVHGRAAYAASSGERYLRGCYADRAEMRSTYRALVSDGRFK